MNLTLSKLFLISSLSYSPALCGVKQIQVFNCKFSNLFSSVLYSRNARFSVIGHTKFSYILDTAIQISNDDSPNYQNDKTFSSTLKDDGQFSKYTVTNCLFHKCESKENGGGIKIGNPASSTIFTLSNTGFSECKGAKGDAFYCETKRLEATSTCISLCPNNAFYFSGAQSELSLNNFFVSSSALNINSNIDRFELDYSNISKNSQGFEISATSSSLDYCNFIQNEGKTMLSWISKNPPYLSYSNFIQNKYTLLLQFTGRVDKSSFIEDQSETISQASITLSYSYFDLDEQAVKKKTSSNLISCNYSSRVTATFDFSPTEGCWNKMPKTKEPTQINTTKIIPAIAVTILIIGMLFTFFKLCRRSGSTDQVPLIYTK